MVLPSTSWLQAAIDVAPTDPVLNNALTALALAQVGRMANQPDLFHASKSAYAEAVGGLNRKLRQPDECLGDVTLAAASALSIYEVCVGFIPEPCRLTGTDAGRLARTAIRDMGIPRQRSFSPH
jgi:hypothetical protein